MEASFYHTPGRYPGIFGWIFTTDHKRIGLLYLGSTLSFFAVGVLLAHHVPTPECGAIELARPYLGYVVREHRVHRLGKRYRPERGVAASPISAHDAPPAHPTQGTGFELPWICMD